MITLKPQGRVVERIVRARTGEFVVATFFVVESENGLDVRLISVKPVPNVERFKIHDSRFKNKILCLSGGCAKSPAVTSERHVYTDFVSPFFNKFQFFVSQPTRAPSFGF